LTKEEVLSAMCERIFYDNNPFEEVRAEKNLTGMEKLRKAIKINILTQKNFDFIDSAGNELLRSPRFFMWQMEFNASLSRKYIQPQIEEGIADGSIREQDPRILSELFVVLFSFWLGSVLFPGDPAYLEKKAAAIFEILEEFGLSI
jgi:hypothetical protein